AAPAQRRAEFSGQPRRGRDVRKRAVMVVVIETVLLRPVRVRRAVVGPARQAETGCVGLDAVGDVVADEQIQPAVAVVVDEGCGNTPSAFARAATASELRRDRLRPKTAIGYIGERAVAVVAEELIAAEVGQVDVDAAVV